MGLLILERKDYASKYEESRLSVESIEVKHMRDQAALTSALAEARKREDNLKKALGVEKECVVNVSLTPSNLLFFYRITSLLFSVYILVFTAFVLRTKIVSDSLKKPCMKCVLSVLR